MSIRLIARELYRLQQEVDRLERELQATPWPEQEAFREKLRKARAAWQQVRNILDGEKIHP
ncbi:MAG: hypothetical protein A2521_17285 [Deltaproteobacteria bacterium RIFOXYD12_FULL_57_12]|nr:MAG: hypothetical protein A2521_17285 [Deltaproteobacteria bacterium RIFOXYD12_FULL_57_12]